MLPQQLASSTKVVMTIKRLDNEVCSLVSPNKHCGRYGLGGAGCIGPAGSEGCAGSLMWRLGPRSGLRGCPVAGPGGPGNQGDGPRRHSGLCGRSAAMRLAAAMYIAPALRARCPGAALPMECALGA